MDKTKEEEGKNRDIFASNSIAVDIDPLIRAISQGNAVVFVGAGVSQASGLPSWEELLNKCLQKAEKYSKNKEEWAKTRASMKENNFLMVAELLHKGLGPAKLGEYLAEAIGTQNIPSRIHRAIARIPFSLAVTTNYDNLLEYVVHPPPDAVFTWQETVGIFTAINTSKERFISNITSSREFAKDHIGRPRPSFPIIKSHGDLEKRDTIVLTRSQYRDLAHQNKAFNECMKALLTYRTVLFVGCSLTDPDTLALMDEIRMIHGTSSLHYAIVSDKMVDRHYEIFLRESFNIHTIVYDASVYLSRAEKERRDKLAGLDVYPRSEVEAEETDQYTRKNESSDDIKNEDCRTTAVFEILKTISGRAAKEIQARANVLKFGHPLFSRLDASKLLLAHVCEVTGTDYGEICLITAPNSRQLVSVCSYPSPTGNQDPEWSRIQHNSIIGSLFVQRKITEDYIYIPNVALSQKYLKEYFKEDGNNESSNIQIKYKPCHRDVRSELACPILADGECVGVLNLESTIEDAFTRDHLEVARGVAMEIGAAYIAARRRIDASKGLRPCLFPKGQSIEEETAEKNCSDLRLLLQCSKLISETKLAFLLWERDCVNGRLHPNYCDCGPDCSEKAYCDARVMERIKKFSYKFSDHSLVSACLRERRRLAVEDADVEVEKKSESLLNPEGVREFEIFGPVLALPIRSRGHMAAVLVCWSKDPQYRGIKLHDEKRKFERFLLAAERSHRILDVLSNIPDFDITDSAIKPDYVYKFVESIIRIGMCPDHKLWEEIDRLVGILVDGQCGVVPFGRVRVWLKDPNATENSDYYCIACSEATTHGYTHRVQNFLSAKGVCTSPADDYLRYTRRRAPSDPYARLQYPELFGGIKDINARDLGKDPNGSWIVGPIVALELTSQSDDLNPFHETYKLIGFVSVDSHKKITKEGIEEKEAIEDQIKLLKHEQLLRFQRRVVDLATSVLSEILEAVSGDAHFLDEFRVRADSREKISD